MENENKGFNISAKAFITSIITVAIIMVIAYVASIFLPKGEFVRYVNEAGQTVIDFEAGYAGTNGGISFLQFMLSPFLCLGSSSGTLTILICIFLIIVAGAFNLLSKSGLMNYLLSKIAHKYGKQRYKLLMIISLVFMICGSFVGMFEETIPLVPLCVALCTSIGFDVLTGLSISILSVSCGFSAGVCNPFTVGVAQELAGLQMFSGISLRLLAFVLIYVLLNLFIYKHAKKVAKDVTESELTYQKDEKKEKAVKVFLIIMIVGMVIVFMSPFITILQDYTILIVAFTFLLAGIVAPIIMGYKNIFKDFKDGAIMMLPAILLILMASSIRFILEESKTLDTILYYLINTAEGLKSWQLILFIYLIVLVMNFFIGSGSAKAFMLIPIIIPIAQAFGLSSQLCILAFAFGDGFSNAFYPTNAANLIALSLADTSYNKWAKHSLPFQLCNLVLTSLILLLGLSIGY